MENEIKILNRNLNYVQESKKLSNEQNKTSYLQNHSSTELINELKQLKQNLNQKEIKINSLRRKKNVMRFQANYWKNKCDEQELSTNINKRKVVNKTVSNFFTPLYQLF